MTTINIIIEDIPVTTQGQAAKLVKFQGQLDESNVDEKAKTIYQLIEQFPQNLLLLLDFEALEYMNSKSIGYLTDWYGKVAQGGGQIVIAKAKNNILDILQVVGLTQLINCYPTLDEAKFALLRPLTQQAVNPAAAMASQTTANPEPIPAPAAATTPVVENTAPIVVTPAAPAASSAPTAAPAPSATPAPAENPNPTTLQV